MKRKNNKKIKFSIIIFFCIVIIAIALLLINFSKIKIRLNGEERIKVVLNSEYIDQGASAFKGIKNISKDIKVEGNVDTTKCGEYIIKYSIYNDKGIEKTKITRTILVYDDIAPIIQLKGNENIIVYQNKEYFEPGYTVTDNYDIDLQNKVVIKGNVDTTKIGEYRLSYEVTDSSNNKAEVFRNIQVIKLENTLKNGLPILMYHFFYDESAGEKGVDNNYMEIKDFEEQIKYLKENNFYFPTWQEVEKYVEKEEELPEKSVVITVDDGSDIFFKYAVPILQKYNVPATSFVITSWKEQNQMEEYRKLNYVILQSHSHDMHRAGKDGKGRIMTLSEEEIIKDVTTSSECIGKSTVFCYPFGHFNDNAIKALNNADYTLAVTTKGGRVNPGMDKIKLPRVRMSKGESLKYFIQKVS